MNIPDIMQNFLKWGWDLITGLSSAINWLFTSNETISTAVNTVLNLFFSPETPYDLEISPIYLIGGGAFVIVLIAGILRAIL